jgi:hypothetical protein
MRQISGKTVTFQPRMSFFTPRALLLAPKRFGIIPVAMLIRLGTHTGLVQYALSNWILSLARLSMAGVVKYLLPAQLIMPACC